MHDNPGESDISEELAMNRQQLRFLAGCEWVS